MMVGLNFAEDEVAIESGVFASSDCQVWRGLAQGIVLTFRSFPGPTLNS